MRVKVRDVGERRNSMEQAAAKKLRLWKRGPLAVGGCGCGRVLRVGVRAASRVCASADNSSVFLCGRSWCVAPTRFICLSVGLSVCLSVSLSIYLWSSCPLPFLSCQISRALTPLILALQLPALGRRGDQDPGSASLATATGRRLR